MGKTFFVADAHLEPSCPERLERLKKFFDSLPSAGDEIYFLGDLFSFWCEYEHFILKEHFSALAELKKLSDKGVKVKLLFGNRDFAMGDFFSRYLDAEILGDTAEISTPQQKIFLTHGDLLCTNDRRYQRWRKFIRSGFARWLFRLLPTSMAYRRIAAFRQMSKKEVQKKSQEELGIAEDSLLRIFHAGYDAVICGHTHKFADRSLDVDGRNCRLINLGDWSETPSFAVLENGLLSVKTL